MGMLRSWALVLWIGLVGGCAVEAEGTSPEVEVDTLDSRPLFFAVERDVASLPQEGAAQAALVAGPTGFYLALHESALDERFFLSAFMKDYFPSPYGPYTLGTRVVRFRMQNGRLFVLDADERKHTSDVFDPTVLVDAYPIIEGYAPFERLRGSEEYILIDPSAGLSRFGVVGDDPDAASTKLEIELSLVDRVRVLPDGVHYDLVFTGYMGALEDPAGDYVEPNPYRASGTIGVALRRYSEGEGYAARDLPRGNRFFSADPYIVTNEGSVNERAARFNIREGHPIEWLISREVLDLQADPRFEGADLIGAFSRAVTNWNTAFGFEALTVRVAEEGESVSDDSLNVIVLDTDQSKSFAFANWRTNPNTGEVRGASVYMGGFWTSTDFLDSLRPKPAMMPAMPGMPGAPMPMMDEPEPRDALSWGPLTPHILCDLDMRSIPHEAFDEATPVKATPPTLASILEPYLTHFIVHEIGHTLGLRHNFKGSLLPASSSVMDYLVDADSLKMELPGAYDVAAIHYLYGMSEEVPSQPFCTDQNTCSYGPCDPNCTRFDTGETPLRSTAIPAFQRGVTRAMTRGVSRSFDSSSDGLLAFVRFGTAEESLEAWTAIETAIRGDLATAPEAKRPAIDAIARRMFQRLYLSGGPASNPDLPAYQPTTSDVVTRVRAELRESLIDSSAVRSFATRRVCVDALRAMQSVEAYRVLLEARGLLESQIAASSDPDRIAATRDLLTRIDVWTQPYFD